jgi:hypothetical protein
MDISSDPIDVHQETEYTEELEVTQEPLDPQQNQFEPHQNPLNPQQQLSADPTLSLFNQHPVEAQQETNTAQEDSLDVQEELEVELDPLEMQEAQDDDDVLIQEALSVHVLEDSESEQGSLQKNQPEYFDLMYKEDALDGLGDEEPFQPEVPPVLPTNQAYPVARRRGRKRKIKATQSSDGSFASEADESVSPQQKAQKTSKVPVTKFKRPTKRPTEPNSEQFKCHFCFKVYSNTSKRHVLECLSNPNRLVKECPECSLLFKPSAYSTHKRNCHKYE